MTAPIPAVSFDAFYRLQHDRLFHFFRRKVGREAAFDLVQEAFTRMLRSGALERVENPQAYLNRTAQNLLIESARAWRRKQCMLYPLEDAPDASVPPEQEGRIEAAELRRIPDDHMKRGKAHMVPLSAAALAVLAKASAFRIPHTEVVFPGMVGKPMSDMTLLKVLRDMSAPFHVHGFRSSFTDWAANEGFADAVVEAALAHKTPDAVQAAYRRTTYLGTMDQPGARVELMEAWGRFCVQGVCAAGNVVPQAMKDAK